MYCLYQSEFELQDNVQYNTFVKRVLYIGEQYIRFLISKNRIFLPVDIDHRDASVDLLAEIFYKENKVLIKFRNFFKNNFPDRILIEIEYERYLKGFIASIIQNNLIGLYKDIDTPTYNIYRNLKEAATNSGLLIAVHFTDKYIQITEDIDSDNPIPEREDLFQLVNSYNMNGLVSNIPQFLDKLFTILKTSSNYSPAVRLSDLVNIVKTIHANELLLNISKNETRTILEDKINISFVLENIKDKFIQKLDKYVTKNKLSQSFYKSMYRLVDEVLLDYKEGSGRRSVKELQKTHFGNHDKYLFYKIQYCLEMFEGEIINYYKKEQN